MEYIFPSVVSCTFNCKIQKRNRYFRLQIIRQDVYTDMNVVPILPLKEADSVGRVLHLNAYALDFFKHGSEKVIEKENGLVINKIIHGIEFLQESLKLIFSYLLCRVVALTSRENSSTIFEAKAHFPFIIYVFSFVESRPARFSGC